MWRRVRTGERVAAAAARSRRLYSAGLTLDSFEEKVLRQLREECGVQAGARVLLSVSGGCDSMAMLHAMKVISTRWKPQLDLEVIHFNHRVRPESDEEEEFVSRTVKDYKLCLHVRRMNESSCHKSNFQDSARKWRHYEIMKQLKDSSSPSTAVAATAHHLNDQVETSLLKLIRGTHLSHFHPMLSRHLCFVRPLLGVSKQEITSYMNQRKLPWREDASNLDDSYKRNAIRHNLVPVMANLAGSSDALHKRLSEIGAQSIQLKEWLEKEVVEHKSTKPSPLYIAGLWCEIPIHGEFQCLPHMVQSEYLRSVIHQFMRESRVKIVHLSFDCLESILRLCKGGENPKSKPMSVTISKNWLISRVGTVLRVSSMSKALKQKFHQLKVPNQDGFITVYFPFELMNVELELWEDNLDKVCNQSKLGKTSVTSDPAFCLYLKSIPTNATIHIRTRGNGDVYSPMNYHKSVPRKLSSFLQDKKVPLHVRDHIPIVTLKEKIIAVASPHAYDKASKSQVEVCLSDESGQSLKKNEITSIKIIIASTRKCLY